MDDQQGSTPNDRAAHRIAIARSIESLIDLDIVVDDRRQDLDRAVAALRSAVREREREAAHLAWLKDTYEEAAS